MCLMVAFGKVVSKIFRIRYPSQGIQSPYAGEICKSDHFALHSVIAICREEKKQ